MFEADLARRGSKPGCDWPRRQRRETTAEEADLGVNRWGATYRRQKSLNRLPPLCSRASPLHLPLSLSSLSLLSPTHSTTIDSTCPPFPSRPPPHLSDMGFSRLLKAIQVEQPEGSTFLANKDLLPVPPEHRLWKAWNFWTFW